MTGTTRIPLWNPARMETNVAGLSGDVKDAETKVHFTVDAAIVRPAAKKRILSEIHFESRSHDSLKLRTSFLTFGNYRWCIFMSEGINFCDDGCDGDEFVTLCSLEWRRVRLMNCFARTKVRIRTFEQGQVVAWSPSSYESSLRKITAGNLNSTEPSIQTRLQQPV